MTSYWDSWGSIVSHVFEGDERIPVEVFEQVLEGLLSALHDYDHEHGGHVLDIWCGKHKLLEKKIEWLRCSLKTRGGGAEKGHYWSGDKCLYCKAPKSWFVKEPVVKEES